MENENQPIQEKCNCGVCKECKGEQPCECGTCKECRGFFGSKTNGVLLLILIGLMIIALVWMWQDRQKYLPMLEENKTQEIAGEDVVTEKNFQIEGNKEDLISFSITPGQEVSGKTTVTGTVQGGYFFEGNILINILDANKVVIPYGPRFANATTDWMTSGPVSFSFDIDFTSIQKGDAYIQIMQDDPRDESERGGYQVKKILIPIVIK